MRIELTLKVANPDVAVLMYEGAKAPLGLPAETGKTLAELAAKEAFTGKDKELVVCSTRATAAGPARVPGRAGRAPEVHRRDPAPAHAPLVKCAARRKPRALRLD